MREILPGILTWPWFSARHGYDFNGWLVRHPQGNVCIDPAEMADEILEEIAREGVARIVLTNRNHFRSSMRVRERTGARIAIHPADAEFARGKGTAIDDELLPGEAVGPFAVVDAHGKSPGEIALHWPARRILLIGDACVRIASCSAATLCPNAACWAPRFARAPSQLERAWARVEASRACACASRARSWAS